jgi:hypothetical protein
LIDEKADVNRTDEDGATCLIFAAMRGWLAIAELLVDRGAEVNLQDEKSGWTALMQATYYGHKSIAMLLIDSGANISLQAGNGCTAFDIASIIGDTDVVRLLYQASLKGDVPVKAMQHKSPSRMSLDANNNRRVGPPPPSPKGSPYMTREPSANTKKKPLPQGAPSSLVDLRKQDKEATLRPERGPATLAALEGASSSLGEDTLRSSQHSLNLKNMHMNVTTSTMGSGASTVDSIASVNLIEDAKRPDRATSNTPGKNKSKSKGKGRASAKVSPSPLKSSSAPMDHSRPGSAGKESGGGKKKKTWWMRIAARFARFKRRKAAKVEVLPGPAVGSGEASADGEDPVTDRVVQPAPVAWQDPADDAAVAPPSGPVLRETSGVEPPTALAGGSAVASQPSAAAEKNLPRSVIIVPAVPDGAKPTALPVVRPGGAPAAGGVKVVGMDRPGRRESTTSRASINNPLTVRTPASPAPAQAPPWQKMGGLMVGADDPMNLSILTAAASGGISKRPSLNMGAPMSRVPTVIMESIKPPFMPPPAFELHHIERPKFERPSLSRSLPDGGGSSADLRPRSSAPFIRPSIGGRVRHAPANRGERTGWSLPRKSIPANEHGSGSGSGGEAAKAGGGGGPKKRKPTRVSFLSPTPSEASTGNDANGSSGDYRSKQRSSSVASFGSSRGSMSDQSPGSSADNRGGGNRARYEPTLEVILQRHNLAEFYPRFQEQEMDLESFLLLTDDDMKEMGIDDRAVRAKLSTVIAKIRGSKRAPPSKVDSAVSGMMRRNSGGGGGGDGKGKIMLNRPPRAGSSASIGSPMRRPSGGPKQGSKRESTNPNSSPKPTRKDSENSGLSPKPSPRLPRKEGVLPASPNPVREEVDTSSPKPGRKMNNPPPIRIDSEDPKQAARASTHTPHND